MISCFYLTPNNFLNHTQSFSHLLSNHLPKLTETLISQPPSSFFHSKSNGKFLISSSTSSKPNIFIFNCITQVRGISVFTPIEKP
ncbi:hypothetical protein HanRHA438_Chr09g0409321 [Helianthus annuus]|nr:hypothetical protein HanRHA438_Chr09g0409321 [Helianthus annuus]